MPSAASSSRPALICLIAALLVFAVACSSGDSGPATFDIAFIDAAGNVRVADSASGDTRQVSRAGPCRGAAGLTWSPDRERYACFWSDSGVLALLDQNGRSVGEINGAYYFSWSMGGSYLSYADADAMLHVIGKDGIEVGVFAARVDYGVSRWNPALWLNDATLLYSDPQGTVSLYDVAGGESRGLGVSGRFDSWTARSGRVLIMTGAATGKELEARIYNLDIETGTMTEVYFARQGFGYGILSPNGRFAALMDGPFITAVSISSGATMLLADLTACGCDPLPAMIFSPSSAYVYWDQRASEPPNTRSLYRVRVDNATVRKMADFDSPWASLSPDGEVVAYLDEGPSAAARELWVIDIETGKRRKLTEEAIVFAWPQ